MRHIKRGAFGAAGVVVGGVLVVAGMAVEPLLVQALLAGVGVAVIATSRLACVETTVNESSVTIRIPPIRTRRIPLVEIREAEIVVADNLVPMFGGWNSRAGLTGAMVRDLEGDRSVGNRAVRLHLVDGGFVQVGSWKPAQLVASLGKQ